MKARLTTWLGMMVAVACALSCSGPQMRMESPEIQGQVMASVPPPPPKGHDLLRPPSDGFITESYDHIDDNPFVAVSTSPLSTFSIDVDTASYSNVRRFLREGSLPPKDAVRIEEFINYFQYAYLEPEGDEPFSVAADLTECPWASGHELLRIALKGKGIPVEQRPASNLVFLIDVSGSMRGANKLPLVKRALRLLVDRLTGDDRIAMVVYAGAAGVVLDSTPCTPTNKSAILDSIEGLEAGGSTHGSAGITLAYEVAREHFIDGGANRVILASDGDFNVGVTNQGGLVRLIEEQAQSGVFLTVLGFGTGNLKDSTTEKLADKGNGNCAYIDTIAEARKVFIQEMGATLVTIAKDVKIQTEFNPARVAAYRLVGYENRLLRDEDFGDDTKDAGEIGAGHTVTALYEIVPVGVETRTPGVDALKYQSARELTDAAGSEELATIKLRYKAPDGDTSKLTSLAVKTQTVPLAEANTDLRFVTAVAGFGMLLRESPYRGDLTYDRVAEVAQESRGTDTCGYRAEFVGLVQMAKDLQRPGRR
ncbi:MAG: VWA domain-containing protein [bacterium]|nr:VWA domain-containing protein [bacterium]